MKDKKLFLFVLGGKPAGRNVEQHDVFFAVGVSMEACAPAIKNYWDIPGVHIDTYMVVEQVDGFDVGVTTALPAQAVPQKLFFINGGGYQANDLEEYHKKIVVAAETLDEAKKKAKQDQFFFEGVTAPNAQRHIDDKISLRGFDVDDVLVVSDQISTKSHLALTPRAGALFKNNTIVVTGYLLVEKVLNATELR